MSERERANTDQTVGARLASVEGLRGIAIILVVLSHLWTIVDLRGALDDQRTAWIFSNGNYAVSTFFLIAGYFAASSMMRSDLLGTFRGSLAWLVRRLARIVALTWLLLAAVVIVSVLDDTDTYTTEQTRSSVVRVALFSWNWWAARNALVARPDLGHLWYVSVYVQILVVLVAAFWLLRRYPWVLLAALTVASAMTTRWRAVVLDDHDIYQALLKTTVRAEPMLWGATLGVLLFLVGDRYRDRLREWSLPMSVAGAAGTVLVLVFWSATEEYFSPLGTSYNIAMVLLLTGLLYAGPRNPVSRGLSTRVLVLLGAYSLAIYVWHYPIFWAVSRHSADWSSWSRVAVAFVLTALASWFTTSRVDRRVTQWLDTRLPR